jgi:hypothetical protein
MIVGLVITKKDPAVRAHEGGKIRCPKCAWEPAKSDRWLCEPGCGHVWNTFETRGCCPACSKQWTETVCLRCHQWSPHDEWYVSELQK